MYRVFKWNASHWQVQPPARHSVRALHLQSSPHRDSSWLAALRFCLALPVRYSRLCCLQFLGHSQSRCASSCHRGQTGLCPNVQTGWKRSSRETCLFVVREIGGVKGTGERERKGMPVKWSWENLSWREKKKGEGGGEQSRVQVGGPTHSTGLWIYAIDISTHQLLVIALAHKLQTLLYVTNYFS